MMTEKQIDAATLDELNEELAAGGMPSGETDLATARKSVRALVAEFAGSAGWSHMKIGDVSVGDKVILRNTDATEECIAELRSGGKASPTE